MTFFNPEIPLKQKEVSHHPWENRIKDIYSPTYKYGHNSAKNPVYPPKKEKTLDRRVRFTVIGNRVTKEFIYCLHLVRGLYKYRQKQFEPPIIRGVTSVEWPRVWDELKLHYGGTAYCLKSQVAVLIDNQFLGGERELKELIGTKFVYDVHLNYYEEGIQQFTNFVQSSGRPFAYLHVAINGEPIGVLIFMLYADIVPLTCENFLRMCDAKKSGYAGTPIHRIVKDCWIQCGGFGLKSKIKLGCENFIVPHDRRGVLCMANNGRHVDCTTQFFVLLQPAPWMKHKYVAFGQLIEGENVLKKLETVPTWYESPTVDIKIFRAGVFNMECHWRQINRKTIAYIFGHIEDLVQIGDIFYEALLENVFKEIELRELQQLEAQYVGEETGEEDERTTEKSKTTVKFQSPTQVKGPTAPASVVNNEFDVDVYDYEIEEYSYGKQSVAAVPSLIVKPEVAYYIPLTDVPYPGEIDSVFNLQKLLRGDYCLESDLEQDRSKRNFGYKLSVDIPDYLLDTLFETFDSDRRKSDNSLDSDDENIIKEYIKENSDTTSFAGPVVKKMAHMQDKFHIFEDVEGFKTDLITDEELRIIRLAKKEAKVGREKKVSISVSLRTSASKIKRRPTGFIRPEDIAKMRKYMRSDSIESDDEDDSDDEMLRKVQIKPEPPSAPRPSRRSMAMKMSEGPVRQSVLFRLYDDVTADSTDEIPTLKGYKPTAEMHHRKFSLLKNSPQLFNITNEDDSKEKHNHRHSIAVTDSVFNIQHGKHVVTKISSDYVRTMDQMEHYQESSLRSIEFAKLRPALSVEEYQMKNKKFKDDLKTKSKNGSCGLRLPGDTPLYQSEIDIPGTHKS